MPEVKNRTGSRGADLTIRENVALAPMTTLGIGGPARYFADVTDAEDLAAGIRWARDREVPLFILGGGSNIVVGDSGFPGLVLRVSIRGIDIRIEGEAVTVTAGAGEEWDPLVAHCIQRNYAGIECLSGIPGRIGATPIQNVGAYGQEVSETIVSIDAIDLANGRPIRMSARESGFGYRTSRFKTSDRDRYIISSVTYRLAINGRPAIRYPELRAYLDENGLSDARLADVRDAVLAIRRRKAMVIDPADPDSRSVGSFFVNPVVSPKEFEQIKDRIASRLDARLDVPAFPMPDGQIKIPAAWLIERAGFRRGHVRGNVGLSTKHPLAIINRGGGTAREVADLATEIRSRVFEIYGITLTPEPVFVGI
jgi:UDP-N-acetylmuramate dehydrogenase